MNYLLAVHGGAGTIKPGDPNESAYHVGMFVALEKGKTILALGGTALDAAMAAVAELEDNPIFNAGHGAVYNAAAEHELDAGIMDGRTMAAGAIAAARTVRNPILVARRVLDEGRCVLLCGDGADQFAIEKGMSPVPNQYFSTDLRLQQLLRVRETHKSMMTLDHGMVRSNQSQEISAKMGTVGAVALDMEGNLAAATSTGGMTNKRVGRVGDTPVVGAGVYANNASCAVSATGTGEHFLRACVGYDIHARMCYGDATLTEAAHASMMQTVGDLGGIGGVIAISKHGELATPYNSVGMYRGWVRQGESTHTRIFS
jgi:beta-aspartyl-peptidase (threonine type)